MNKVESKKLFDFLDKDRFIARLFTQMSIIDSALEDGKWPDFEYSDDDDIYNFIVNKIDFINFKKLLLLGVHSAREMYQNNKSDFNKAVYERFLAFAKQNIRPEENVYTYIIDMMDNSKFTALFSSTELYNRPMPDRNFKIDPNFFSDLIGIIDYADLEYIFKSDQVASIVSQTITYRSLIRMGFSTADIERIIADDEESKRIENSNEFIKNYRIERDEFLNANREIYYDLDEDNFLAISASNFVYLVQRNILDLYDAKDKREELRRQGASEEEIKKVDPVFLEIDGIVRLREVYKFVEETIDPSKVNIKVNNGFMDDGFSLEKFRYIYKKTLDEYGKIYIERNRKQLFNVDIIALLEKKTALSYLPEIDEKHRTEYYFLLYESLVNGREIREGKISPDEYVTFKEFHDYLMKHDSENEHFYTLRALTRYLTGSKTISPEVLVDLKLIEVDEDSNFKGKTEEGKDIILKDDTKEQELLNKILEPDVLFSVPLSEPTLYEMLDDKTKITYAKESVEHIMNNGKYKNIALRNISTLINKGDIGIDFFKAMYSIYYIGVDDIERIVKKENLEKAFSPEDLFATVQEIIEDHRRGINTEKEKAEHEISLRDYVFLKNIYKKYGFLEKKTFEEDIINIFDDLIFDDRILGMLYHDGFISGKTLIELNQDLANKFYEDGSLNDEDKRLLIFNSNFDIKVGDLIRLNQEKLLSYEEIFDFYMSGRISLDDLSAFGEGTDFGKVIKDEELFNLVKRSSVIRRKEVIDKFERYYSAYMKFKNVTPEVQEKLLKYVGRKNIREEDLIELYSKGLISIQLLDPSDDLLYRMIKGKVLRSEDEEFLFKDTDIHGRKYLRLISILRRLSDDDEKINLMASVYKDDDYISSIRLDMLANELSDGFNEDELEPSSKKDDEDDLPKTKKTRNLNPVSEEKKKAVRSLGKIFKAFKEIDPKFEHDLVSGTYIVYLGNSALVEQVFRETNSGKEFSSEHATYIISEEFFKNLLQEYYDGKFKANIHEFFVDVNRAGKEYFRWSNLTKAKRKRPVGLSKVLHTENWTKNLKTRLGIPTDVDEAELQDCLDEIDESTTQVPDEI